MFKVLKEIPFSWLAIGFVVLTILFLLFFSTRNTINGIQFAALEARLTEIEDRIVKFEAIDSTVTKIWEQAKAFERFKEKFDRSETSMTLRMDHIVKNLDRLEETVAKVSSRQAGSASPENAYAKTSAKRYHTVISGESLYSISRKYGLTVDKIRLLNKLEDRDVIHPKQKLLIAP